MTRISRPCAPLCSNRHSVCSQAVRLFSMCRLGLIVVTCLVVLVFPASAAVKKQSRDVEDILLGDFLTWMTGRGFVKPNTVKVRQRGFWPQTNEHRSWHV